MLFFKITNQERETVTKKARNRKKKPPTTPKKKTPKNVTVKTRVQPKRRKLQKKELGISNSIPKRVPKKKEKPAKVSSNTSNIILEEIEIKDEIVNDFTTKDEVLNEYNEVFITGDSIHDVEEADTANAYLYCPYCYISFGDLTRLENHALLTHAEDSRDGSDRFKCPHLYCSEKLCSIQELRNHQKISHNLKS